MRQVIAAVAAQASRNVPQVMGPRRAGDPPALYADPRRAKDVLG